MMNRQLQIGSLSIEPNVMLAPMAGYTDLALRRLCRRFGAGLSLTEVANAAGLVHGSKPTWHLLETDPSERPVGAHIYGSDPGVMAEAARQIEDLGRFDLLDINAGCPVRKIVAKGSGVALMKDPAKLGSIVEAVREAVSFPVTVKTRIGLDEERINIREIARVVEQAGADAIAIHARVASRHHKGPADWDLLAQVKSERAIPVIGNGGVDKAEDAKRMLEQTGVDGVMIGRAAVGRPWIFAEVMADLQGEAFTGPTLDGIRDIIKEHLAMMVELKIKERVFRRRSSLPADQSAALHFRAHLLKYLSGMQGWASVRRELQGMSTLEAILGAVDEVIGRQKRGMKAEG